MIATATATKGLSDLLAQAQQRVRETQPLDTRQPLQNFQWGSGSDGNVPFLLPLARQDESISTELPRMIYLAPRAHRDLLRRVDYPTKLYQRLPSNGNLMNLNWLIQHSADPDRLATLRLVRDGESTESLMARAVLGSAYTPLDDVDVLALATKYAGENAEVRFDRLEEASSVVTVTWPGTEGTLGLQRGVEIGNSEVGHRSLTIEAIAYRLTCNNVMPAHAAVGDTVMVGGKRIKKLTNGKHDRNGAQIAERGEASWRITHTGNPDRLDGFVRDAIESSKAQYEALRARWIDGMQRQIADPIGAIERVGDGGDMSAENLKSVLDAWADTKTDFGPTSTGIANAFTLAAQDQDDNDGRDEMNRAGRRALDYVEENPTA